MHRSSFESPPAPQVRDVVRVVAPAGPFNRTLFFRGLGFLAQTFRIRWSTSVFHQEGFLCGTKNQRLDDFMDALACPDTRLIVCARGGVGSVELCAELTPNAYPPKWLLGFSDITALHATFQRHGLMSLHGPNVTSLGVGNAHLRERCLHHVLDPCRTTTVTLAPLVPGNVVGPVIGGNLAVLHDLCAANAWHPPHGAILFVEEVAEAPYRIHRMLTAMRRGGHLSGIVGLIVGQITHSNPGPYRVTARQVITTLCQQWQLPAAWGIPSGHDPWQNDPLTLGGQAHLNVTGDAATVTFNAR